MINILMKGLCMKSSLDEILEVVAPSSKEAALAKRSKDILSKYLKINKKATLEFVGKGKENTKVELPSKAMYLLIGILHQMEAGHSISLVPIHNELTTQEAADLLNVSRPYLIHLLKEGEIPYRKVGTRRKILAKDVLHYKETIKKKRRMILQELSALGQEIEKDMNDQ